MPLFEEVDGLLKAMSQHLEGTLCERSSLWVKLVADQ
jgi:hypothetical protein